MFLYAVFCGPMVCLAQEALAPRSLIFTHSTIIEGEPNTDPEFSWNEASTWDALEIPTFHSNVSVRGGYLSHVAYRTFTMMLPAGNITVGNFECGKQVTFRSEGVTVLTVNEYANLGYCYFADGITLILKGGAFYNSDFSGQVGGCGWRESLHLKEGSKIIISAGSIFTSYTGSIFVDDGVYELPDVGSIEVQSGGRIDFYQTGTGPCCNTVIEPWFELAENGEVAVHYKPGQDYCDDSDCEIVHFATGGNSAGNWSIGNTPTCLDVGFCGDYQFESTNNWGDSGKVELNALSWERGANDWQTNSIARASKTFTTESTHSIHMQFNSWSYPDYLLVLKGPKQTFTNEVVFGTIKIQVDIECAIGATCRIFAAILDGWAYVNRGTTIFSLGRNADTFSMRYDSTFDNYGTVIFDDSYIGAMKNDEKWFIRNHVGGHVIFEKSHYKCNVKLVNAGIIEFAEGDRADPYTNIDLQRYLGSGTIIMESTTTWKIRMTYDPATQKVICDRLDFSQSSKDMDCTFKGNVEVEIIPLSAFGQDDRDWTPSAGDSCGIAFWSRTQYCGGQLSSVTVTGYPDAIITLSHGPEGCCFQLNIELCDTNCDITPPDLCLEEDVNRNNANCASSSDTTSGDTTSGDTTSGDTTSGDTTPADTIPADTNTGDTTSGDTTSGNTTPADTIPADTNTGDTTPGDTTPGDTTFGDEVNPASSIFLDYTSLFLLNMVLHILRNLC